MFTFWIVSCRPIETGLCKNNKHNLSKYKMKFYSFVLNLHTAKKTYDQPGHEKTCLKVCLPGRIVLKPVFAENFVLRK